MQHEIHFSVFAESMEKAHSIPHADMVIVLQKPDVSLRKQDQLWRRTCAKHGISTAPLGVAKDDRYHKIYYLEGIVKKERARIAELEKELSVVKTALARAKLDLARIG